MVYKTFFCIVSFFNVSCLRSAPTSRASAWKVWKWIQNHYFFFHMCIFFSAPGQELKMSVNEHRINSDSLHTVVNFLLLFLLVKNNFSLRLFLFPCVYCVSSFHLFYNIPISLARSTLSVLHLVFRYSLFFCWWDIKPFHSLTRPLMFLKIKNNYTMSNFAMFCTIFINLEYWTRPLMATCLYSFSVRLLCLDKSALRFVAHGDIVVPSHQTDWGRRSFFNCGCSWNLLPVDLRSSSFRLDIFAKRLKTRLFGSLLTRGHKLLNVYHSL